MIHEDLGVRVALSIVHVECFVWPSGTGTKMNGLSTGCASVACGDLRSTRGDIRSSLRDERQETAFSPRRCTLGRKGRTR